MNKVLMNKAETLAAQNYHTIFSRDQLSDDTVVFIARNPELKGCKAFGATPSEALDNLREARIDYIYALVSNEIPVPGPESQVTMSGALPETALTINEYFPDQPSKQTSDPVESDSDDILEFWSQEDPA